MEFQKFHRIEQSMSGAWYGWVECLDDEGRPCSRPIKFIGRKPSQREVENKAVESISREEVIKAIAREEAAKVAVEK